MEKLPKYFDSGELLYPTRLSYVQCLQHGILYLYFLYLITLL